MHKLHLNFRILLLFIPLLFLGSCNDWLDLEPQNALVVEEFWQKREDVEAVLAAMYDNFRANAEESFLYGELRADMLNFEDLAIEYSSYYRISKSDITSSNGKANWSGYYSAINLANTILQFAPEVQSRDEQLTAETLAGYEAEALFIRSLNYFFLVRTWKDVPYVTEATSSDTIEIFLPKSDEYTVLSQVIKDLELAEEKAFDSYYNNRPELFRGRANRYAIQALLADIHLWMGHYQQCIDYCNKVINEGIYQLQPGEPWLWFEMYNPGNCMESIFEIQFDDKLPGQENSMHRQLFGLIEPAEKTSDLFSPDDLRQCGNYGIMWKYQGVDYESMIPRSTSERDANFIYYRYADLLMMKAEALGELGLFDDGTGLINLVAERAGMLGVLSPGTLESYRSLVLDERAREFAAEGKRWYDILRFAKRNQFEDKSLIMDILLEGVDIKELPSRKAQVLDTMGYYLPIPERDLLYNPNLIQNPFYDK
ncbi:MAG: RagB/SusD family nutrient uptake outer membrane protein [Bacteroidota bacterium]